MAVFVIWQLFSGAISQECLIPCPPQGQINPPLFALCYVKLYSSPMSSFQTSGFILINPAMSSLHSVESRLIISTPRDKRKSSPPVNGGEVNRKSEGLRTEDLRGQHNFGGETYQRKSYFRPVLLVGFRRE